MIRRSQSNFCISRLTRPKLDIFRTPLTKFGISRRCGPRQCVRDRCDWRNVNRDRRNQRKVNCNRCDQKNIVAVVKKLIAVVKKLVAAVKKFVVIPFFVYQCCSMHPMVVKFPSIAFFECLSFSKKYMKKSVIDSCSPADLSYFCKTNWLKLPKIVVGTLCCVVFCSTVPLFQI